MNKINRLTWKRYYKKEIKPQLVGVFIMMFMGGLIFIGINSHLNFKWLDILGFSMVMIPLISCLYFCIKESIKQFRKHRKQIIAEGEKDEI